MGEELEKLSAQIAQLTSIVLAQKKTAQEGGFLLHEGGPDEMAKDLKYGQGSVTKQIRLSYVDEYNIRQVKTTAETKKANQIASKYKCKIYVFYIIEWFDEYGKRKKKVVTGKQPNGKPVNKEYARKVLVSYNKRSLRNLNKKEYITFGIAMHQWYKEFRMDGAGKERNTHNIREINRLPKDIYNARLQDVTAQMLQKHLNDMKHDNPRLTAKSLLSAFLNFMFLQGVLAKDIGKLLKCPLPRRAEKQVLTTAMEPKFLELLPEKFRKYAIGLIYTGCRYSEFISIQAEDVDKANKTIVVRDTKSIRQNDKRRGIHFKTRVIPLLPQLEDYEFPLPYISQAYFQNCFKKASIALGIKVTPHDMRHTFATRCDDHGIKEKVIQSILGHKNERMTRHYKDHKTAELLESEFNKIRTSKDINVATENTDNPLTLTLEEETKLIATFPEKFRNHIIGLIYTGCKFTELARIRAEDIDRTNKTIFIKETTMGSGATKAYKTKLLPQIEQLQFPLPEISKKYFFNLLCTVDKTLGRKVTAEALQTTFIARCKDLTGAQV